jgi:hypothetical protein
VDFVLVNVLQVESLMRDVALSERQTQHVLQLVLPFGRSFRISQLRSGCQREGGDWVDLREVLHELGVDAGVSDHLVVHEVGV